MCLDFYRRRNYYSLGCWFLWQFELYCLGRLDLAVKASLGFLGVGPPLVASVEFQNVTNEFYHTLLVDIFILTDLGKCNQSLLEANAGVDILSKALGRIFMAAPGQYYYFREHQRLDLSELALDLGL